MEYFPTFTIKIQPTCRSNMPYMDPMCIGNIHQRRPDLRPEAAVFPAADEVQAGNFAWQ